MVLCIKIADQCLKGCLNLGLTSFPSPVSIRAYTRSDKAFCLVNNNTFYACFSGEEKAALCFDSFIIGPPGLFTWDSKDACFSILATRLPKRPNLWHPVGITDCIQSKLDGQDTASTQKSGFSSRHLSHSQPVLFLNCALSKNRSKHMMIMHLPEGFDQAFSSHYFHSYCCY